MALRWLILFLSFGSFALSDTIPITGTWSAGFTNGELDVTGPGLFFQDGVLPGVYIQDNPQEICSGGSCQWTSTFPFVGDFQAATFNGISVRQNPQLGIATGTVGGKFTWVSAPFPMGSNDGVSSPATFIVTFSGELTAFQSGSSVAFMDVGIAGQGSVTIKTDPATYPNPFDQGTFEGDATTLPEPATGGLIFGPLMFIVSVIYRRSCHPR